MAAERMTGLSLSLPNLPTFVVRKMGAGTLRTNGLTQGPQLWITGVGDGTPLGHDYREIGGTICSGWPAGRYAMLSRFDASQHPARIAAQVKNTIPCPPDGNEADFAGCTGWKQAILWCVLRGLALSGWWPHTQCSGRPGAGLEQSGWRCWDSDRTAADRLCGVQADAERLCARRAASSSCPGPHHRVGGLRQRHYALAQARRWAGAWLGRVCLAALATRRDSPGVAGFGNLRAFVAPQILNPRPRPGRSTGTGWVLSWEKAARCLFWKQRRPPAAAPPTSMPKSPLWGQQRRA